MIITIVDPRLYVTLGIPVEVGKNSTQTRKIGWCCDNKYSFAKGPNMQANLKCNRQLQLDFDTEKNEYLLYSDLLDVDTEDHFVISESVLIAKFSVTEAKMHIINEHCIKSMCTSCVPSVAMVHLVYVAYNAAKNRPCAQHLLNQYYKYKEGYGKVRILSNLCLCYNNMEAIEALGEALFGTMANEDFKIESDRDERHKMLGLPKRVANYISQNGSDWEKTQMIKYFQSISSNDPNEIIAIVDYLEDQENTKKYVSQGNDRYLIGSGCELLKQFSQIRELDKSLDLRKVLNYCIKQRMLRPYNDTLNSVHNSFRYMLSIPSKEAEIFADYLKSNPSEKFPQNLYRAHNVAMLEIDTKVKDGDNEKFAEYGRVLSQSHNWEFERYRFEVPTNYQRFLAIGKEFKNCLPLCGEAFFSGLCDIVFVYAEEEKDFPIIALETNPHGFVIQAKKKHDMDIDNEDELNAIKKYESWLIQSLQ